MTALTARHEAAWQRTADAVDHMDKDTAEAKRAREAADAARAEVRSLALSLSPSLHGPNNPLRNLQLTNHRHPWYKLQALPVQIPHGQPLQVEKALEEARATGVSLAAERDLEKERAEKAVESARAECAAAIKVRPYLILSV